MTVRTVYTTNTAPAAAARELREQLGDLDSKFTLFFASSSYDAEALGVALAKEFQGTTSIGCTTAGELVTGKMLKNSVALAAFDSKVIESVHTALVRDARDPAATRQALSDLGEQIGTSLGEVNPEQHFGLVLHDGLSVAEETVMSELSAATNVPFVGGSAGDDLQFKSTSVFLNYKPLHGVSVLALLEPVRPYHVLKTQSFRALDKVLDVTSADEATRTVHTFNGNPASEEYAAQIGVSVERLPDHFQDHPVGLVMSDGEPFVRSPMQIRGTDVVFYCRIAEGMKLNLLQATDIVEQTEKDLQAKLKEAGSCQLVINFHCILRTLELEAKRQTEAYGKAFNDVPTIGFSTYGESYIGHVNQTSTMVILT